MRCCAVRQKTVCKLYLIVPGRLSCTKVGSCRRRKGLTEKPERERERERERNREHVNMEMSKTCDFGETER